MVPVSGGWAGRGIDQRVMNVNCKETTGTLYNTLHWEVKGGTKLNAKCWELFDKIPLNITHFFGKNLATFLSNGQSLT